MKCAIGFVFFFILTVAESIHFTITPKTFVPGVTSSVTMRCDVADSGRELTQLLLIQLERQDKGIYIPVVTYTPEASPHIMSYGTDHNVQVDGTEHQFGDISSSYLSVTFPFPVVQVAANYTCVVSGLSSAGLLARYTMDAPLVVGAAVDELPRFMTAHVVELRSLIEKIRTYKNSLMSEAAQLREMEKNVSLELTSVEVEYANVTAEMANLRSRASQLMTFLNQPVSALDRLSSVRPDQKVAFHTTMSSFGAKTATLNVPLVFDHVITNQGQGYDPSSGVFKAPIDGTYVITASVEAGSGHRDSELSIMSDGHVLQTMHMSDDIGYQHHTTSTIVHLHQGQEVTCQFTWVKGFPGYLGSSDSRAPYITAFTGYVLW